MANVDVEFVETSEERGVYGEGIDTCEDPTANLRES